MIQIIPAIIAQDFEELQEKIKKVESYVDWVQLDVMDGKFVKNETWQNSYDLKSLNTNLNLEAHLMVQNPENIIDDWIKSGVQRIIFHYESTDKHGEIIERIKQAGLQVGLAINPKTSIEVIDVFVNQLDIVLIMTIQPGFGGQKFLEETLWKIKDLRERHKDVKIGVDGGINSETASKVIEVGANILFIGSTIFKSKNIEEIINELKSWD
ncbi:MAG: ribulose-phosphate 3-epimerase [Candidatus Portnoybacteria bacterium]|nr:ribulose-phosphate 3-epimerase [Candidatus Portnoybacteria bacterium]